MVREYGVGSRDVFVPFQQSEVAPVHNAAILAPWPNRLDHGAYTFAGYRGQLPVNELDRLTALHGLVCWVRWELVKQQQDSVTLQYDLPPQRGWPYQLRFTVTYQLTESGLTCEFTAQNVGATTAPYGVGFHPWLSTGGANLDDCQAQIWADQVVLKNQRLLPTGVAPVSGSFDLRQPTSVAGLDLDDAWVEPVFDANGKSWVVLDCPDGFAPAVWMERPFTAWQVCTANHIKGLERYGLAAEPMTCVADAFNTGHDLIHLAPGERHTVRWGAQLQTVGAIDRSAMDQKAA